MAKIGVIPNYGGNNNQDECFNYEWVLNELNKDYDIEGINRIGFTDDGYEVFIVTDDYMLSDIPHFHYRKKEKNKKMGFHTCIRFDKAEYYNHIGNEDVLNDNQKENLIKFLSSKPKYDNFNTNWELLIFSWEHQNNSQTSMNEILTIPSYTKLTSKSESGN